MGSALLLLRYAYVSNMSFFFTMSFSFLFSSFERNEALGKENESQQKKRSQKWDFCVFLSIHLSPLFLFKNHFIGVFLFLFLHVLQKEFFMLYAGIIPDVQMSQQFYQLISIMHGGHGMEIETG